MSGSENSQQSQCPDRVDSRKENDWYLCTGASVDRETKTWKQRKQKQNYDTHTCTGVFFFILLVYLFYIWLSIWISQTRY